jgi:hypothetical protein
MEKEKGQDKQSEGLSEGIRELRIRGRGWRRDVQEALK